MDSTLLKGLNVLEVLIRSERPRGVSEFAAELGLTKSNVHRVLQTLQAAGYVAQLEAGTYQPTLKTWELGSKIHLKLDVARQARPHLIQLASLSRETVHLSVLDGAEVVYIDKIDSPEPVRAYSTIGGRAPAHCVATGKVLLAFSDGVPGLDGGDGFRSYTSRTITARQDFEASCSEIRAKGYAVNWGEWRDRVRGIAAPVRDTSGSIVAAAGVSGPAERLTRARISELIPRVAEAARLISGDLGFRQAAEAARHHA